MQFQTYKDKIIIVDFGSQVTKLIARRIRELGVYSEIVTPKELSKLNNFYNIKGIILSGGPSTVTATNYQSVPRDLFKKNSNFGICYGLQLIAKLHGGKLNPQKKERIWKSYFNKKKQSFLTKNFKKKISVWMSHEDAVVKLPKNFKIIASTKNSKLTIIENNVKKKFMVFSFILKLLIQIMENNYLRIFIFNL